MTNDEEYLQGVRREMLRLALETLSANGQGASELTVVQAAKRYEAYVMGEDAPAPELLAA